MYNIAEPLRSTAGWGKALSESLMAGAFLSAVPSNSSPACCRLTGSLQTDRPTAAPHLQSALPSPQRAADFQLNVDHNSSSTVNAAA